MYVHCVVAKCGFVMYVYCVVRYHLVAYNKDESRKGTGSMQAKPNLQLKVQPIFSVILIE